MTSNERGGVTELLKSMHFETIVEYYKHAVDYGLVDVALHPYDLADTLIRLGYEPFPPMEETPLFQKKSLVLPGIPSYMYYLYSIDGISGMFRGVVPFVTGNLIYRHLSDYVWNRSPFSLQLPEGEPHLCEEFTSANVSQFVQSRFWRLMSSLIALSAAYPFHVVGVRTMARFVTATTTQEGYRPNLSEVTWLAELRHINSYTELFAGCLSRTMKEIVFTVIATGSFFTLMKVAQLLRADPQQANRLEHSVEYLTNSIATMYTNPFRNVSDIMIINKTDIPLGNPPFNDYYNTCWDCIWNLRKDKKWKTSAPRGLFQTGRHYNGPVTRLSSGKLLPKDTFFGPLYIPVYAHTVDDVSSVLRGYYQASRDMESGVGGPQTGPGFVDLSEMKRVQLNEPVILNAGLSMEAIGLTSMILFYDFDVSRFGNPLGL